MIRIAVCDDDSECLNNAVQMIEAWVAEQDISIELYRFDNGDELISKNAVVHMDIIFLDIIMPLLSGIDTAKELRENDKAVKIVFLTSSPEFALQSYEVKAYDYLLKPISYRKVKEVLDECNILFNREPKNFVIKTSFGYQKLYFHDIEYAEAQNRKVFLHLRNGKSVEATEPFYSFENKLMSDDGFFKCHRSYLVYLPNVGHFDHTCITTKSGRIIPIARGYSKAFHDAYFAVMFQE
jgi:Response regulator of the LytR/AlgR family